MRYRKAELKDLEEILIMKNKVKERVIKENLPIWQNGYPLDEMIIEDVKKNEGRVVEIDGEIVAYACFHHRETEYPEKTFKYDNVQCFGRVMVKENYVGRKIGSFLVSSMIEEAKNLDVLGMGILADECNIKAVNLYKKHGFTKEGSKQFPYAYLDIFGLYFI